MNCSVCGRPLVSGEEKTGLCPQHSNNKDKAIKKVAAISGLSLMLGATIGFLAGKSNKNKS